MAIGIKVKKAPKNYDFCASKFFGAPTIPLAWKYDFYDDEIFFCQIRLADIAHLDKENKLPHSGYLYVFLRTDNGDYDLEADVRYFDGEPELVMHDFNTEVEEYEQFNHAYLMEFFSVSDSAPCTRLLGVPSDWNYQDAPRKLLMQYDPLDSNMGFLEFLDGFVYLFFGKNKTNFAKVTIHQEYS